MRGFRVLVLVLILALVGPRSAQAVDIHGNDAQDTYSGVGGLVLPSSSDPQSRREAASCEDCAWLVSDACDTPYGVAFLHCRSDLLHCPPGSQEKRAWMRHGNGLWFDHGLLCVTPEGPPTLASVGAQARGAFVHHLPRLAPSQQPAQGVVTQLPVLFDSGQPSGAASLDVSVAGVGVHLEARARWTWTFGDGATTTTVATGSRWPDVSVSHIYRVSGRQVARVVTQWVARYWIDGVGPFPVPEEVSQEAVLTVLVGEGRAALAVSR
jgi:hypothetical protein